MQKNNIRMVVQSVTEGAATFAERLETFCYDLHVEHKDKMHTPPIVFLTSAGDGRQTATLQFITTETDKNKEDAKVFSVDDVLNILDNYQIECQLRYNEGTIPDAREWWAKVSEKN